MICLFDSASKPAVPASSTYIFTNDFWNSQPAGMLLLLLLLLLQLPLPMPLLVIVLVTVIHVFARVLVSAPCLGDPATWRCLSKVSASCMSVCPPLFPRRGHFFARDQPRPCPPEAAAPIICICCICCICCI